MINKKKIKINNTYISYIYNYSVDVKNDSLVIMIHGFGDDNDGRGIYTALEKELEKNGISSIRFDMPGHGESSGCSSLISVDDIISIVKSLIQKNKYKNYYLVGSSYGASVAVLASKKLSISKMVLYSPLLDFKNNIIKPSNKFCSLFLGKRAYDKIKKFGFSYFGLSDVKIGEKVYDDAYKYNPNLDIGKIKSDILIFHGDNDEVIPFEQSNEITKKYKNISLKVIKNGVHLFEKKQYNRIVKDTIKFLSDSD